MTCTVGYETEAPEWWRGELSEQDLAELDRADLARSAGREGVSLNQFVTSALAGAVGW